MGSPFGAARGCRTRALLLRMVLALLVGGALAGCNSTGGSRGGPTVAAPPEATMPAPPPIPASQASFRFEQMLGVPTNAADTLAAALGNAARARGLTLVRRGDPTASYRVLGYLSASGDADGTQIVFVWDIFDAEGRRLTRLTGTQAAGGASGDPWAGVSSEELEAVAAHTVEMMYAWANRGPATVATAAF